MSRLPVHGKKPLTKKIGDKPSFNTLLQTVDIKFGHAGDETLIFQRVDSLEARNNDET